MINTLLKRRMENTKKNKKGFTLVELIVVLVIIAILAAVLVPTMSGYISRARKTAAQSDCKSIVTAYQAAVADNMDAITANNADIEITSAPAADTAAKKIVDSAKDYGANKSIVGVTKASGANPVGINRVKVSADGALTELIYTVGKYTVTYNNNGSYSVAKSSVAIS